MDCWPDLILNMGRVCITDNSKLSSQYQTMNNIGQKRNERRKPKDEMQRKDRSQSLVYISHYVLKALILYTYSEFLNLSFVSIVLCCTVQTYSDTHLKSGGEICALRLSTFFLLVVRRILADVCLELPRKVNYSVPYFIAEN